MLRTEPLFKFVPPCYRLYVYPDGGVDIKSDHNRSKGKSLSQWFTKDGYRMTKLSSKGVSVHAVVAAAFHGPRPEGLVINHIDGDKHNNHPDNLEYCTIEENITHSMKIGLHVSHNPERHGKYIDGRSWDKAAYKHSHYIDNKDAYIRRAKAYYLANKDKIRARNRQRYLDNKNKVNL